MIEYTYYKSGHWKAECSECGWEHVTDSVSEAHTQGAIHRRRHL